MKFTFEPGEIGALAIAVADELQARSVLDEHDQRDEVIVPVLDRDGKPKLDKDKKPLMRRAKKPVLLDRQGLSDKLTISTAALDRLRAEPGFPELAIGDAPRFELDRVLAWLRARSETPGLRAVG